MKTIGVVALLAFWLWPAAIWSIDFMAVFVTGQTLIVAAYDVYMHGVGGMLWLLLFAVPSLALIGSI